MGLIAEVIEDADSAAESADADLDTDDASPYLSHATDAETIDPFLSPFDFEHIKIDKENLNVTLGLLVVISNLFG